LSPYSPGSQNAPASNWSSYAPFSYGKLEIVTSLEERVTTTPALTLSAPVATQQIAGARRISFFMAELSRRFPSAYRGFFSQGRRKGRN